MGGGILVLVIVYRLLDATLSTFFFVELSDAALQSTIDLSAWSAFLP
jgi:hypothetical protein